MTRVVRSAVLLCLGGIILASAAFASTPDPSKCTLGNNLPAGNSRKYIRVGGYNVCIGGDAACTLGDSLPDRPDPASLVPSYFLKYDIVIKRSDGVPIQGSNVTVIFDACSDIEVSCNQVVTKTSQVRSNTKRVFKPTDANGVASFEVIGFSKVVQPTTAASITPGNGVCAADLGCVRVLADGTPITGPSTPNPDLRALVVSYQDFNNATNAGPNYATTSGMAGVCLKESTLESCGSGITRARSDFTLNLVNDAGDSGNLLKYSTLTPPAGGGFGGRVAHTIGQYCP